MKKGEKENPKMNVLGSATALGSYKQNLRHDPRRKARRPGNAEAKYQNAGEK